MSTTRVYLSEAPPKSSVEKLQGYACRELGDYLVCAPVDVLDSVPAMIQQWIKYFVDKGSKPPFTINFGDALKVYVYPAREEVSKGASSVAGLAQRLRSGAPAPSTIVTSITTMLGVDTQSAIVSFLIRRITTILVPTAIALLYVTNVDGRKVVLHTFFVYLGTAPTVAGATQQSLQHVLQRIKVSA